jgi:hypothetical protein
MNKLLLAIFLVIFSVSTVWAKEATPEARLHELRDQNKQKIAERINQQLAKINLKTTQAFTQHLAAIQNLLTKAATWKDKAKTNGKDVTAAETAIAACQTAIATAQEANEAQKLKTYTVEYTDETQLRTGAKTVKTNLRTDLTAVREKVKTSRQKLIDAIKIIKQLYPAESKQ